MCRFREPCSLPCASPRSNEQFAGSRLSPSKAVCSIPQMHSTALCDHLLDDLQFNCPLSRAFLGAYSLQDARVTPAHIATGNKAFYVNVRRSVRFSRFVPLPPLNMFCIIIFQHHASRIQGDNSALGDEGPGLMLCLSLGAVFAITSLGTTCVQQGSEDRTSTYGLRPTPRCSLHALPSFVTNPRPLLL